MCSLLFVHLVLLSGVINKIWRGRLYYRRTRVVLCRVNKRCTCLLQVFLLVERLILSLPSTNPSYPGIHWYINLVVGSSSSTNHRRYQPAYHRHQSLVCRVSLRASARSWLARGNEQLVQRYAQTEWVSIKAMPGPEGPYALSNAAMVLRKRGLSVCVAAAARPTLALVPGFFFSC